MHRARRLRARAGRVAMAAGPAFLAALAPAAAFAAAGGDEHGSGLTTFVWHSVNLLLLIGVLVYFARGPIASFLNDRRAKIEDGIHSAGRELAEAERKLAACEQRIASLDEEIDGIRSAVQRQAESERDRLLAEAHGTAERIRRDAVAAVEQEVRHARAQLRAETVDLAVQLAGELLRSQVGDADRTRLVDDFVQRIEALETGDTGPRGAQARN
jgi:F-type H+-transporting ATPase subunit b